MASEGERASPRVDAPEPWNSAVPLEMADHRSALRTYLRRRIGRSEDLDDFVQDVYLRVLSTPPHEDIRSWRGFLMRIASNLVIDHHRRGAARMAKEHISIEGLLIQDPGAGPDQILDGRRELMRLGAALDELGPVARDAFLLVRVDGLSHKEAARRLDITPKAVSHHIERSLARLASHMGNSA